MTILTGLFALLHNAPRSSRWCRWCRASRSSRGAFQLFRSFDNVLGIKSKIRCCLRVILIKALDPVMDHLILVFHQVDNLLPLIRRQLLALPPKLLPKLYGSLWKRVSSALE